MMDELLGWTRLTDRTALGLLVTLGYPVLALAALEISRSMAPRRALTASILQQVSYLVLPTGAVWLILEGLAGLPPDNWAVRTAETAFSLTALYVLLRLAQAALLAVIEDKTQAPKLLLDILRIGLSLVWSAVFVSRIWGVDLGSLFAAMGVGSIVLGFALQEFLGNLLSGLGLLSAHKFGIGDWIVVDGGAARIVEMDWRTVTLIKSDGNRVVVANSTLAKGNLVIAARAGETASISVPLVFGLDIPPEQVRAAVLEAARGVPSQDGLPPPRCVVTGMTDEAVTYSAVISVASPGIVSGPRDEFLSRLWYVAQRRGLRFGAPGLAQPPDADARRDMLHAMGAFHGDAEALAAVAAASAFRQYRTGEAVLSAGEAPAEAFFVLTGSLAISVASGGSEVRLETVQAGQLLVLHETLAGGPSPVQAIVHDNAEIMAIPAATLHGVMERNRTIARDVTALAEARRLALQPLGRGLRAVA